MVPCEIVLTDEKLFSVHVSNFLLRDSKFPATGQLLSRRSGAQAEKQQER